MEETILLFLAGLAEWVPTVLAAIGGVVVVLRAVVKMTPSCKDDELVAKIDKIPVVGGLLAGVASIAAVQFTIDAKVPILGWS